MMLAGLPVPDDAIYGLAELIGAGRPHGVGELRDRVGVHWKAGEHHSARL